MSTNAGSLQSNTGIIINNKRVNGLQTGDIVRAVVPNGKYQGTYTGRIMVRSSGTHDIHPMNGKRFSMTKKTSLNVLQHLDGYQYSFERAIPLGNKLPSTLA